MLLDVLRYMGWESPNFGLGLYWELGLRLVNDIFSGLPDSWWFSMMIGNVIIRKMRKRVNLLVDL